MTSISAVTTSVSNLATVTGGSIQIAPALSGLPAQPAAASDPESPRGDRPTAAVGASQRPDSRGSVDARRPAPAPGRSVLATTTLSHSVRMPSDAPDPAASPRDMTALMPLGADLIAEVLPFAGDSLEHNLDEFVRQLEAADVGGLVASGPAPIVVATLAVLGTAASALVAREVVRRRSGRGRGLRMVHPLGRELALSFPELPRSWSEKH